MAGPNFPTSAPPYEQLETDIFVAPLPLPPPVPTLTVTPSSTQNTLTWTPSNNAVYYNIYRSTTSGAETLYVAGVTGTTYVDNSLTNGTTYYYKVTAVNSSGNESSESSQASGQPETVLAPTSSLTAQGNTGSVGLTWSAVSGATSYTVNRGTTPNNTVPLATGVMTTSYTDSAIVAGTQYYYTVTAINGTVVGTISAQATATPLIAPTSPAGSPGGGGFGVANLTWTAVPGATGYAIYRGTSPGSESAYDTSTGPSYTDLAVTPGTTYYYKILATAPNSASSLSSEISVKPTNPVVVSSIVASPGQVVVSWSATTGATTYDIYRSTSPSSGFTLLNSGIGATTYTDSTVVNGTTYYYMLAAVNSTGTSTMGPVASAATPTATPVGLSATTDSGNVTITWQPVTGAVTYTVYRGTSPGSETSYQTGVTGTSFTDSSATAGTTYYYKVTSVATNGESSRSSEVSVTPMAPPASPAATGVSSGVTITWSASTGATSYTIVRAPTQRLSNLYVYRRTVTAPSIIIVTGVTGTTYTDTTAVPGIGYFYQVQAVNAQGQSALTAQTFGMALTAPTGVTPSTSGGSNTISWSSVAGASTYNVYRGAASGFETLLATGITGLSYVDTAPRAGAVAYYQVTAVSGSGESGPSAEVTATALAAPAAPASVAATASVVLTWSAVTGATSYSVYRGTVTGGETSYATGISALTYTDSGASNGTQYFYKIKAVNGSGSGPLSAEVTATPIAVPGSFAAVPGCLVINLSWSAAAGATSYDLYRGTSPSGETLYQSGLTGTSYEDTAVTASVTYYYKLVGLNSTGSGTLTSEESAVTDTMAPATPAGLVVTPGAGQLVLTWDATTSTATYNIYRGTTPGGETYYDSVVA